MKKTDIILYSILLLITLLNLEISIYAVYIPVLIILIGRYIKEKKIIFDNNIKIFIWSGSIAVFLFYFLRNVVSPLLKS